MKKLKLISLICSLMMVISCFAVFPAMADTTPTLTTWGEGTAEEPYIISNANFADFLANAANYSDKHFRLGEDIVINNGVNDGTAEDWAAGTKTPTKTLSAPIFPANFTGTFDGNGKSISGIYMKGTQVGLFYSVNVGSVVKNLRLLNSYFESTQTAVDANTGWTGGTGSIAARLYHDGKITNVYSEAILKNTSTMNSTQLAIGGIVGWIVTCNGTYQAQISNCVFAGSISGAGATGGILGYIHSEGEPRVKISNCLNLGVITSRNDNVGGIIGQSWGPASSATIEKCMNLSPRMSDPSSNPSDVVGGSFDGTLENRFTSVTGIVGVNGLSTMRAAANASYTGASTNQNWGMTAIDLSTLLNADIVKTGAALEGWSYAAGYVPNPTTHTAIPLSAIINADTLGLKSEGEIHSVRISNTNKGLRFITLVSDNGVTLINELKKIEGATVAMNTYITAAKYFTDAQYGITEFTKEALGADRYIATSTSDFLLKNGVNDATVNAFAGSVVGINDLTMEYLAVGCVTVTVGNTTLDIYASWNTDEATSVSTVASAAAEDVETEAGVEGYGNLITDINGAQVYSPYTQAQYDCIKSLIAAQ